jgi:PhzF family phenazine biosynthesis protein
MKLKIYQVDAFTGRLFSGNPAAVVPLPGKWLKKSIMQDIAKENNLSETAFYFIKNGGYYLRWFTPAGEVDLCGHATLATAFVLFNCEGYTKKEIHFDSRSGVLTVRRDGRCLTMDFPVDNIKRVDLTREMASCFNFKPVEVWKGKTDYMLVFGSEEQIKNIKFDIAGIGRIKARGIIITAKGEKCDFVSRFFAPQCGVNEDPVTGSAHTTLVPYWSKKLGKSLLTAMQLSERKGYLTCRDKGSRVEISGKAVLYMTGEIEV